MPARTDEKIDTRKHRYVANTRSKTVHRLPASESCNTDQITFKMHYDFHHEVPSRFRDCRRCFPQ